jgi:hypothetical protein
MHPHIASAVCDGYLVPSCLSVCRVRRCLVPSCSPLQALKKYKKDAGLEIDPLVQNEAQMLFDQGVKIRLQLASAVHKGMRGT